MNLTDLFVLPQDVSVTPVEELSSQLRARFEHERGDFAVTRHRSRTPSSIISADAAQLVEVFREPRLVIEAIVQTSLLTGSEPDELLVAIYPILEKLILRGILVPYHSPNAEPISPSLGSGAEFERYSVVRPVQVLDDTEVYLCRYAADLHHYAALKLIRTNAPAHVVAMLRQEAAVLDHLNGSISPRLLSTGTYLDREYLLTEWCLGSSIDRVAAELRDTPSLPSSRILLLCDAVVAAYATLHAQGVMHGDIHPRNVLTTAEGHIVIIDYGLARHITAAVEDTPHSYRGGVGFFFDPECAGAMVDNKSIPKVTYLSEQYSIGALVYQLLTGVHYLDFSLERAEMLRQIRDDASVPLRQRGIDASESLEDLVSRPLQKAPEQRFPSMAAYADAFRAHVTQTCSEPTLGSYGVDVEVDQTAARLLQRLAMVRAEDEYQLPAPSASVTYGAAGVAYAFYRIALATNSPQFLAVADVWAESATRRSRRDDGFTSAGLGLTSEIVGEVSPFHTVSGVHAVSALIGHSFGDHQRTQASIDAYCKSISASGGSPELTLGSAGALLVASTLVNIAPSNERLRQLGSCIASDLLRVMEADAPLTENESLPFLGVAHGWTGLIYALLRWYRAVSLDAPSAVRSRLDELTALGEPRGRGIRWPVAPPRGSQSDTPEFMAGWCHGTAGYVHLWSLASEMYQVEQFQTLAERAGWNVWEEQSEIGQLCCGLAGQAYALLRLYQWTHSVEWLSMARLLAGRAASSSRSTEIPHSLYKGALGVAVLLTELEQPATARMPFFDDEGWSVA